MNILYRPANEKTDRRRFLAKFRGKELEWRKCENIEQEEEATEEGFLPLFDAYSSCTEAVKEEVQTEPAKRGRKKTK